jgi:hypothetical protein
LYIDEPMVSITLSSMTTRSRLAAFALVFSAALASCTLTPDPFEDPREEPEDPFPSSITEIALLDAVSYSGSIGGSPMQCQISLSRLSDGALFMNSGYAPLTARKVATDGHISAEYSTSIGKNLSYYVRCVTAPTPSGIVVVTGFPAPQIWMIEADGSIIEGAQLPMRFVPELVRSAPNGGFFVVGKDAKDRSSVVQIDRDFQVAWTTILDEYRLFDIAGASDGRVLVVGHIDDLFASERAASLIVLGSGGEVIAIHEYTPRRWNMIHQIEPLSGGRFLLLGENQGGGHTHTWMAVVDSDGRLAWDNEGIWSEWEKASLPKRAIGVIENVDGSLELLSADARLTTAGSDQKTTTIGADGSLQGQVEWTGAPRCRPVGKTVIEIESAYLVYVCGTGSSMSGQVTFEHSSRLYRLR